jgi:DNA transposition AAA+ family ATPase
VLTRHWRKLGLQLDDADCTDHQATASIARITGGNFHLLDRLFVQIERILKINKMSLVTDEVVVAARSTLVIGATYTYRKHQSYDDQATFFVSVSAFRASIMA